jgi:hypothetical protein
MNVKLLGVLLSGFAMISTIGGGLVATHQLAPASILSVTANQYLSIRSRSIKLRRVKTLHFFML